MFKKSLLPLAMLLCFAHLAQAQFDNALKKAKEKIGLDGAALSQDEVGRALKEALDKGVGSAVDYLSAKDGYFKSPYKILVPDEAQKVVNKLKVVPGFQNVEADLTERMNRAAELAAKKATPIFVAAIKQMTFQDAMNLLMGNNDAATRYLERTTADKLYADFKPVIQQALDEVNAREYWRSAVTAYNKLPMVTKTNPELDDHVTRKALVGLYALIEKKEQDIRANPALRTTELLKKVFAKQDKK